MPLPRSGVAPWTNLNAASIGIPFIIIPRTALIQTEVPAELQGRIFSLVNLTVVGLTAVSSALTGMISEILPVNILYAVIGLSATVVGAAAMSDVLFVVGARTKREEVVLAVHPGVVLGDE